MKNLILLAVLSLVTTNLFADDTFAIRPYIIIGNEGALNLNFETVKDTKLDISVEIKNKKSLKSAVTVFKSKPKRNELQKLDIGTLKCDSVLRYKISSEVTGLNIDQGLYSIPCNVNEPLYFGFMSDTQIKDKDGQKRANTLSLTVSDLKQKFPLSLIVNAGDVVQHGGDEAEWLNFFNTASVYLQDSFLWAAVGNHEYFDSPMNEKAPPQFLKYLRDERSNDLGNAALDLGRITILMVNSNFEWLSDAKVKEQWEWLEEKIKENQKINKPVIVTMHHSPFSSSAEWVRDIPTRLRKDLVPMLEKYSVVKVLMSGHLHMYERSVKNNIQYLVAGPSGGIINYITYKNPYSLVIKPFVTTFTVFKVTDKEIEVTTYTGLKEVIDNFKVSL